MNHSIDADPGGPDAPGEEIIVRTEGLGDEELAAVVAVVRQRLAEELAERDGGVDETGADARRWRHALRFAPVSRREWR